MSANASAGPELPALALAVSAGLGASSLSLGPTPALLGAGVAAAVAVWLVLRHRHPAPPPPPVPPPGLSVLPATASAPPAQRDEVYQAVLDHIGHGVAALDRSGAMLVYNPAAKQILGTMTELPIGRALAGEVVDAEDVHVRHPKTGRPMWLRVTARPLELEDEGGTVVVFQDVTARKEVEVALARSEARHRALMQAAPYGIAILDADHRLVEHNPALQGLLGHPVDLRATLGLLRVGADQETLLDLLSATPTTAQITTVERADGTQLELEVSVTPIATLGAAPALFAVTLHDLTDRVRAERMKDEFISTVSHELRTPLTSIMGSLRLLSGGAAGPLVPDVEKMVGIAASNSQRLLALVDDILDLQRLATGRLDFSMQPVELGELVAQAVDANRAYTQELGVALELELPGAPVHILGDPQRLLQVLANLLSNAAKYSRDGQTVTLTLGDAPPRIHVTDRGPGIPEALRPRVFERFAHGGSPANPSAKIGTGLGLAISLAIVEHHGGTLTFDTDPDRGTTFTLALPPR